MAKSLDTHSALIYVMVTMSAVDRDITDTELSRIGDLVSRLPVFKDFNSDDLIKTAQQCGEVMSKPDGLEAVLQQIATSLPTRLHETAYALAVEIAAVDLDVKQEELRFLQLLRDHLELDKLAVAAIERGARARHQVL